MTKRLLEESSTQTLVNKDGRYKIVLISPGKGSTGYYTEEMLREFAPAAWPKGSHSYVDHPTKDNPHRSVKDLIGSLDEDAFYEDNVGVVSWLKPRESMVPLLEEVKDLAGLSIYAEGTGHEEDIDGETVYMVESLTPNVQNTVDLVAYAGRGGHFTESLIESALNIGSETESSAQNQEKGHENMALEDEVKTLISKVESAVSELVAAREALVSKTAEVAETATEAEKAIDATVAVESAEIPASLKASLLEEVKAGNYDVDARIKSGKELRAEILEEAKAALLAEGVGSFASSDGKKTEPTEVKGWN